MEGVVGLHWLCRLDGACVAQALPEPQWLKIDIRTFDMAVLGKFGVIMADPPVGCCLMFQAACQAMKSRTSE